MASQLQEVRRIIEIYAFRLADFAFVDVAFGPFTDIALAGDSAYDPANLEMLPPIRVRCLTSQVEKPFGFYRQETK